MCSDGDPLEQLTSTLDPLVDADPASLAGGDAVVALHRQLARLEAVAARVAGAFERTGFHNRSRPGATRPGAPEEAEDERGPP